MNDMLTDANRVPPVAPPADAPKDSLKETLFRTLQLAADTPNAPAHNAAPIPDSPERVMTDDPQDYSEGRGTMADIVSHIEKKQKAAAANPPVEPVVIPAVVAPTVVPVVVPPVEPAVVVPEPIVIPKVKLEKIPTPEPIAPTSVAPFDISKLDLSGLDEDEINEVKTAAFAEQRYPDKYKGYAAHVLDYIKKHKQIVRDLTSENQDGDMDENDPKYKAFVKANRPPVKGPERRKLERERTLEEAAQIAEARLSQRYRKVETELTQMKAAPAVEKSLNDYKSLLKQVLPTSTDDPLVESVVAEVSNLASEAAGEFLQLSAQLKPYDSRNNTHRWLADFIAEQGKLFANSKDPATKRGNKTFIPRAEYNNLNPTDRAKHFTFSDEDVLQIVAVNAKAAAEFKIKEEQGRMEKFGYRRSAAPAVVPPKMVVPPVEPELSPRAGSGVVQPGPIGTSSPRDPFMSWMTK